MARLASEALIARLESILICRETGDLHVARSIFDSISAREIPDIAIPMSNGIEADRNVLLFYIDRDWDNDYADSYIVDLLNAIDDEVDESVIQALAPIEDMIDALCE